MKNYSLLNKFLHKFYLKNYFISKSTFEYEKDTHQKKINEIGNLEKVVFISGLARSGTTHFMREIFKSNNFASLQYNNMPFLFLPNTWTSSSSKDEKLVQRAHDDGIKVNNASPEEFDEYFWKVFLKDSYIKESTINIHRVDDNIMESYIDYIKLISISKNKKSYISKNNNNILRLSSLKSIPNSFFFFLVRKPLDHASSLLKLDLKFSKDQQKDSFSLEYFNFLGHHEFGLNHKSFLLDAEKFDNLKNYDRTSLNYWLCIWKQYYAYLLEIFDGRIDLVFFEDMVAGDENITNLVFSKLGVEVVFSNDNFSPPIYNLQGSEELLAECNEIYYKLKQKIGY